MKAAALASGIFPLRKRPSPAFHLQGRRPQDCPLPAPRAGRYSKTSCGGAEHGHWEGKCLCSPTVDGGPDRVGGLLTRFRLFTASGLWCP